MPIACVKKESPGGINQMAGAYDFEATIGKGHFAVVKQAKHVFTGEKVAVKIFDKNRLDSTAAANLLHEIRCMKLVRHPNIVRLYEVIDTDSKIFLILELGDYDLYDFITRKAARGLRNDLARHYFSQIVEAISYCHKLHVVHRDLKPENVVFFEKLDLVKLTDFGLSHLFIPGQPLKTSCGSLAYSAPEILLGNAYDAPAVDVWSLGVILYMLVCGNLPFQGASDSETLTRILDCSFSLPANLPPECRQLITRTLVRDPAERLSLAQISSSTWLRDCANHLSEASPLVSMSKVSAEMKKEIMQQMADGGIAEEAQICQALEKDEYNHVTATYYLLAERLLKNLQFEQIQKSPGRWLDPTGTDAASSSSQRNEEFFVNNGTAVDQKYFAFPAMGQELTWRERHCSTVAEESEDENPSFGISPYSAFSGNINSSRYSSRCTSNHQSSPVLVLPNMRKTCSLCDVLAKLNADDESNPIHNRSSSFAGLQPDIRKLHRNLSSPILLKITEEEDECNESLRFPGRLPLELLPLRLVQWEKNRCCYKPNCVVSRRKETDGKKLDHGGYMYTVESLRGSWVIQFWRCGEIVKQLDKNTNYGDPANLEILAVCNIVNRLAEEAVATPTMIVVERKTAYSLLYT
uniref:SNF-related serine/threonine-protein kinase n=1 Tax=Trichuris muris TaxID=70415 RepID=A0A5S6Q8K4_TRIMR